MCALTPKVYPLPYASGPSTLECWLMSLLRCVRWQHHDIAAWHEMFKVLAANTLAQLVAPQFRITCRWPSRLLERFANLYWKGRKTTFSHLWRTWPAGCVHRILRKCTTSRWSQRPREMCVQSAQGQRPCFLPLVETVAWREGWAQRTAQESADASARTPAPTVLHLLRTAPLLASSASMSFALYAFS